MHALAQNGMTPLPCRQVVIVVLLGVHPKQGHPVRADAKQQPRAASPKLYLDVASLARVRHVGQDPYRGNEVADLLLGTLADIPSVDVDETEGIVELYNINGALGAYRVTNGGLRWDEDLVRRMRRE